MTSIDSIRLHRMALPLIKPFRTSMAIETHRDLYLVEAITDTGISGWGECVSMDWPGYTHEYTDGAWDVTLEFLLPRLAEVRHDPNPEAVRRKLEEVKGNEMARTAVSTAVLDAWLRVEGRSLADFLGANKSAVDAGVSVGIPENETIDELLEEVSGYVDAGYKRIKLKIQPGWDLEPIRAVRAAWPTIPLQVDANQAYTRDDVRHLASFDEFGMLLIEQPLPEYDWVGHRQIAAACETPICLDESILSLGQTETALDFKAADIINIKPARVGGLLESVDIHDLCLSRGVPVWCGGMLETGIGRAANVALAAMPGFTLPGDTSASARYFAVDITEPFVLEDGQLRVPTGPGIGVDPIPAYLEELTSEVAEIEFSN